MLSLLSFNPDKVATEDYWFPKVESRSDKQAVPAPSISSSDKAAAETDYSVKTKSKRYEPKGEFGHLVGKYRCFSCHSFKGRGHNTTYDLTLEGSRVRRKWLFDYLKVPYTLRPVLTIRMPIFKMTDEENKILTNTIMRKMVDSEIDKNLEGKLTAEMTAQGKKLFDKKGCLACHQAGKIGGYVGPSFTQGAYVGEKLQAGWIFKWLKNSRAMKPDVLEPDYGLSDQQALAITAYLMSIRAPEQVNSKNGK